MPRTGEQDRDEATYSETTRQRDEDICSCDCKCAKCVVAVTCRDRCVPTVNALENVVFVTTPNLFRDVENIVLPGVLTGGPPPPTVSPIPVTPLPHAEFDYFVRLPRLPCDEVRVDFPLVWLIPQLVSQITANLSKFTI